MSTEGRRDPLAVAGIPFVHEAEPGIEVPARLTAGWEGCRVTSAPVIVRHSVGDTSPGGLAPLVEAPIALGDYFLDSHGQIAVRSRPAQTPGFRKQLLLTHRPGFEYEIRYADAGDSPLLQWGWHRTMLMLCLPLRGGGLVAHATGFVMRDGSAVLCPAVSGGGKSTLARLLLSRPDLGTRLMSDDRIAITEDTAGAHAWGTPWHSSAGAANAVDGPIRGIVFPRRGPGARLAAIAPSAAVREILRTVGLPFWDPVATEYSLGLIDRLITSVPCFEFAYTPSDEACTTLVHGVSRAIAGEN